VIRNKYQENKKNHKFSYLKNNLYLNNPPDFEQLSADFPNFSKYVYKNKYNGYSIKWSDKNALKELNRCLLKKDFDVNYWDIPDGFLIPTITSRLNYICWIKSLLDDFLFKEKTNDISNYDFYNKNDYINIDNNQENHPFYNIENLTHENKKVNYQQKFLNSFFKRRNRFKNKNVNISENYLSGKALEEQIIISGLDIGTGANCIYPLLGYGMYRWHFKASDINQDSIKSANNIVCQNNLEEFITVEKQENKEYIFYSVVKPQQIFYFSMCNPPYFDFSEEKNDNPHTVCFISLIYQINQVRDFIITTFFSINLLHSSQ